MATTNFAIDFVAIADRINNPLSIDLSNSDTVTCLEEFVKSKGRFNENAAKSYMCLEKHIEYYQSILRFQFKSERFVLYPKHWNDDVLNGFLLTLVNKGLSTLYVNKLLQMMKLVLDWSAKHGAKVDPSYSDVSKIPEKPKKELIALTLDDVSMIYHFNLRDDALTIYARDGSPMEKPAIDKKHPLRYRLRMSQRNKRIDTLERVRDAFVLSCCLGQRFSDMKRISRADFNGDKFCIVQQKTGNTAEVDLPRFSVDAIMVRKILEKYDYEFPYIAHISAYDRNLHALFRTMGLENDLRRTVRGIDGRLVSEVVSRY